MYPSHLTSRLLLGSAAIFIVGFPLPAAAQTGPRPVLTAAECQPLTEDNYALCCIAANRSRILTPSELDQCPPITTSRIQAVLGGGGDDGSFFGGGSGDGGGGSGGGGSGGGGSGGGGGGGGGG